MRRCTEVVTPNHFNLLIYWSVQPLDDGTATSHPSQAAGRRKFRCGDFSKIQMWGFPHIQMWGFPHICKKNPHKSLRTDVGIFVGISPHYFPCGDFLYVWPTVIPRKGQDQVASAAAGRSGSQRRRCGCRRGGVVIPPDSTPEVNSIPDNCCASIRASVVGGGEEPSQDP